MVENEPIKNNPEDEQEDYIAPSLKINDAIKDKLEDAGKMYPIWNPKTKGEIVGGIVENVEFLEHLNENNGGWLIRIVDDKSNKFVTFPNKVMQKKLLTLCPNKDMNEIMNQNIFIQYDGEKQPKDKKLKPYKTYTVIRND